MSIVVNKEISDEITTPYVMLFTLSAAIHVGKPLRDILSVRQKVEELRKDCSEALGVDAHIRPAETVAERRKTMTVILSEEFNNVPLKGESFPELVDDFKNRLQEIESVNKCILLEGEEWLNTTFAAYDRVKHNIELTK